MHFAEVSEPWWDDRPLLIVGGGPSLAGRDLSRLRERGRVLGINRVPADTPCDACFSIDRTFIEQWADRMAEWATAGLEVYAAVGSDYDGPIALGVRYLERVQGSALSTDPRRVTNGLNSGYGAINVATLKRAADIVLLGFDLHTTGRTEPAHWHAGYPWHARSAEIYFDRWAKRFEEIANSLPPGTRIRNANPRSAIRCFPFTSYEELGL